MTTLPSRPLSFRAGALLLVPALALAVAGGALADTVTVKFGPIEGVTVTDIKAGRIHYKNVATGKAADEDLGKIKGIKVDGVKGLEEAQAALDAKNNRVAIAKFTDAIRQAKAAKKPWLVAYVQHQLMECHLRQGEARLAAHQYLELAQTKADPFYFQPALPVPGKPAGPTLLEVVKAADENNRKAIFEQAKGLHDNVDQNYQVFVAALIDATGIKDEAKDSGAAPGVPAVGGPNAGSNAGPKTAGSAVRPDALLLPLRVLTDIRENASNTGDIQLALTGRYADAAKAMQGALHAKVEMTAVRLFVLGRVYQEMAGQEKDAAKKDGLVKDAALCFARIGAQFNEPESSFYAPALLEFARINLELGDAAAARQAFEGAADLAENTEDPAYAKRCKDLQADLGKKQ